MPWQEIEASLAKQLAREVKKGRSIQEVGLFGSQTAIVGGCVQGRPTTAALSLDGVAAVSEACV